MAEIGTGVISTDRLTELKGKRQRFAFKTNFNFLKSHKGIRPGCIHILMGTAGSGKSSVLRSLLGDYLKLNMDSVYCWLSEESKEEMQEGMAGIDLGDDNLSKLILDSELDNPGTSEAEILERVAISGSKILIIDNITTSRFYMDRRVKEQGDMIMRLKSFAAEHGVAVFIIAHTKKDIHDNYGKLITENDIRGCSSIVNMAHFFYILQRFKTPRRFYPTLRIVKNRGYVVEDNMYFMQFDKESMSYITDVNIDFDTFKARFKEREVL